MIPEAKLEDHSGGLRPKGEGWFVLNAREAQWFDHDTFGRFTRFEGDPRFPEYGINISLVEPGKPSCMYHGENAQEDFLVLAGECLLLIEGEERPLKAWDFVHCPAWTEHVFVGAGEGDCLLLAIGTRTKGAGVVYPASELAQRHGAGVARETPNSGEAYAGIPDETSTRARHGWLPEL
jgi:uncharacterized cupin superfamily protein